jgi:phage terminase large subunit-like protein
MDFHRRGDKILSGEIVSPQEVFVRFATPEEIPWDSEAAVKASNPGLAIGMCDMKEFMAEAKHAKESGSEIQIAAYRALRLGQVHHFKAAVTGWLSAGELDRAVKPLTLSDFAQCRFRAIGVDLGNREDWSSVALVGLGDDGDIFIYQHSWVSRAANARHGEKSGWGQFIAENHLELTDQDSVGYPIVVDFIQELIESTDTRFVGMDPALATIAAGELEALLGPDSVQFIRQGPLSFTPLIEALEQASSANKLHLANDSALKFAFANGVIEQKGLGRMIAKDSRQPGLKIDPVIAACNGLAVCLARRLEEQTNPAPDFDWALTLDAPETNYRHFGGW